MTNSRSDQALLVPVNAPISPPPSLSCFEQAQRRQALLTTCPNPNPSFDYVVTRAARATLEPALGIVEIRIRMVPDRRVLNHRAFSSYLSLFKNQSWTTLEAAAAAMLLDLINEVVPRWTEVKLTQLQEPGTLESTFTPDMDAGAPRHDVLMEDQQPHWQRPALLARLVP